MKARTEKSSKHPFEFTTEVLITIIQKILVFEQNYKGIC